MNSDIYFNVKLTELKNLNLYIGGRGTGKTYCLIRELIKEHVPFIWLRDNDSTIQIMLKGNCITYPIEKNDTSFPHIEYIPHGKIAKFCEVERGIDNKGRPTITVLDEYGYLCALSTFKNARGVDFSDVKYIVFDECIPEKGTVKKAHQGTLFLNMYETVNRNREFYGEEPVKIVLLTNANDPYSDIFTSFGLDIILESMDSNIYDDADVHVEFLSNEAFKERKQDTFLYRIAKNTEFLTMALDNDFTVNRALIKKSVNMVKSTPVFNIGDYVCIQLKDNTLYFKKGNYKDLQKYDVTNQQELTLFRYMFTQYLRDYYVDGSMFFDSIYTMRTILEDYAKIGG